MPVSTQIRCSISLAGRVFDIALLACVMLEMGFNAARRLLLAAEAEQDCEV